MSTENMAADFPESMQSFDSNSIDPMEIKEEIKSGSCSRYGRARAVPNFAKMIDPLSTRGTSHTNEAARSLGIPGCEDAPSKSFTSLVERVQELVAKIGVTVLAVPAESTSAVPPVGTEKYIGVRSKHVGVDRRFSAVIKKNHSEIQLGVYPTAAEV
jgi:hypothetical protein